LFASVAVPASTVGPAAEASATAPPVPIILDTDILDDVDDVGALALAHALQDKGEADILGVVVDTNYLKSAYCVDAINTYFGDPSIPVGIKYPASSSNTNRYPDNCSTFPQNLSQTTVQEGWKLYRQLLADPNHDEVVIVSLGFMNQLSALLDSGPDAISPLTGMQLVSQKVKELVVMGGTYPNGADYFNFYYDKASADNVIDHWPTRVVFSGEGANFGTGWQLDHSPEWSPVRKAFRDFLGCDPSPSCARPSWDEVVVYHAVRKNDGLYAEIGPGTVTYTPSNNSTVYSAATNRNHYYLSQLVTNAIAANAMETLVSYVPYADSVFVKGINVNGAAATIDGNAWLSHAAAVADGFQVGVGVSLVSNAVAPAPAVDANTANMLTTGLRKAGTVNLSQTIENGAYYVSFYVKEDLGSGSYAYDVRLEQTTVGEVASAQSGSWNRYGPYPVSVIDGVLNMDLTLNGSQVGLQGIEIRRAANGTGSLSREYWTGLSGTSIASIPLASPPSGTQSLTKFEGPVNWSDSYGSRFRGYITPPATGNYTFSIAGDDDSELWLSTNDDPANRSKIAHFSGYTGHREWTKFPTQTSAPVALTAGQRYYVEALHKEGVGWDNLSVGWTGPGIPATTVIAGPYLSPYTTTTSGSAAFLKGVNINGAAVTIEGNAWQSYSAALASGLTVSAANLATNTRTPSPSADSDTTSMLRSELWRTGNVTLNQTVANGDYDVYLWVMEDYQNGFRSFDVKAEGAVEGTIATGAVGSWAKYGPYQTTVTDGSLTIELVRLTGDVLLQGLAIYER
jgi:hypothetical protein